LPTEQDRITVHPRVLSVIAALTALSVPGVARLRTAHNSSLCRLRSKGVPGVEVHVHGNSVLVDLHLVVNAGFGLMDVSRLVQAAVARSLAEMTEMQVRQVNVHVDGVRTGTYS
jgi:uncharacterized alkaline shock family protein YloU